MKKTNFLSDIASAVLISLSLGLTACGERSTPAPEQPVAYANGHKIMARDLSGTPGNFAGRWRSQACYVIVSQPGHATITLDCQTDFTIRQDTVLSASGTLWSLGQQSTFAVPDLRIQGNELIDASGAAKSIGQIGATALRATFAGTPAAPLGGFNAKLGDDGSLSFSEVDQNGTMVQGIAARVSP